MQDDRIIRTCAFVMAFLLLPTTIIAGIVYVVISAVKPPRWSLGILAGLIVLLLLAPQNSFVSLIGWIVLVTGVMDHMQYVPTVLQQLSVGGILLTSLITGISVGAIIYLIRNLPDMAKTDTQRARDRAVATSPANKWMIERIEKREALKNHDGVYLGVCRRRRIPVVISPEQINHHVFVAGSTGSGKTTTLLRFIEHFMQIGRPVIIIDGKGDFDFVKRIYEMSQKNQRRFQFFSLNNPHSSWHYNPLSCGNPTELKDRLIAMFDWTEPHYQLGAARYLQIAFQLLAADGQTIDLVKLVDQLNDRLLLDLAQKNGVKQSIQVNLQEIDDRAKTGIQTRLALLTESSIGHLLADEPGKTIDLTQAIQQNTVCVFSLDKLRYPEFARQLGILITNDLKAAAARQIKQTECDLLVVFDEFNVFASLAIVDAINATRSYGVGAIISTQSLADLDIIDQALRRQIVANCNTYVCHRMNDAQDAEDMAKTIGTVQTIITTKQTSDSGLIGTGMGSERIGEEFKVSPNFIKQQETGEAVIYEKWPKARLSELKVIETYV